MLTTKELLKDPVYRKFFTTVPVLLPHHESPALSPPWWLYLKKDAHPLKWRRAHMASYATAFAYIKSHHNSLRDFAIVSKRRTYLPPVITTPDGKKQYWRSPDPEDEWCPYCRRPTVFKYFSSHHADTKFSRYIDPTTPRCSICGIRRTAVEPFLIELQKERKIA